MKAVTVVPGEPDVSGVRELPDPVADPGELLVDGLLAGVCAADREVLEHGHGVLPPGQERMVLFHESLGRVRYAPAISGFREGDYVVGVMRRPDPEPCGACAAGQWDFCLNGRYTEHGIKELDGFGAERWAIEPRFAIHVDPRLAELGVLTEPASLVAKAWEQVELIGRRSYYEPRHVLVTGAGTIGLLAALMGVQRDLTVHVFDRVTTGPKAVLARELGADYISSLSELRCAPDVVVEATGSAAVMVEALHYTARNAIMVLAGVSGRCRPLLPQVLDREIRVENDVVVGSVNANLRHYHQAVQALSDADEAWLSRLISRRIPLARWSDALEQGPDDIKTVIDLRT